MDIKKFLSRNPMIGKPLLYWYHKRKNGKLVRFWYSTHLSPRCVFEGMNIVSQKSSFYGVMGYGTYICENTNLNADIGRFTSIGPNVKVINATHPIKAPFVTSCPLFFSVDFIKNPDHQTFAKKQLFDEFRYYDKERQIDVKIGNDCWIGEGVTFVGGTEVHDGAVVLAGAYVVKDIPPYSIVGGTPAKIIGYRYSEDEINFLLSVKWWDKDPNWIKENWKLMTSLEDFKRHFDYDSFIKVV